MSLTIYKYTLKCLGNCVVEMPCDAKILTVQERNDCICMWALVDPHAPSVPRKFRVICTDHYATGVDVTGYVGTLRWTNMDLHVFEMKGGF